MEYEAWFNPSFNAGYLPNSGYLPLLTSTDTTLGYDSSDTKVLDQHYAWLKELSVDAVTAEITNNGPCVFGDTSQCASYMKRYGVATDQGTMGRFTATAVAMNSGTFNLYPAFSQRGAAVKLIPVVDGQDPEMFTPRSSDGQTPFDVQIAQYYKYVTQYPEESVMYQGKPLLLSFLGPLNKGDTSAIVKNQQALAKWQDKFTVRLSVAFTDYQPMLWSNWNGLLGLHEMNPTYQVWTWIDRLNPSFNLVPSYAKTNDRVEAFNVTTAAPSSIFPGYPLDQSKWKDAWNGPDTIPYRGGATLAQYMSIAQKLNPIFLMFNGFNEFGSSPDQGSDEEHSTDIEPTKQWGYDKFNFAKQQLLGYRNRTLPRTFPHSSHVCSR